ncbi:UDP-N-acetylglucosamine 2-epimerase (non-hydrolyzing) [Lachnospiraceae bacterium 54-11]
MTKVLVIFGTRPEAVKMCPLVLELKKRSKIECSVCLTGQHKEMLRQVMDAFDIQEDYNLYIMKEKQSLTAITIQILDKLEFILRKIKPDIVLVHGDTSTSYVAALAAFYQQIPVGHVEAGLRTNNKYSPFPEELNRQMTGRIAEYHFAPTPSNKINLKNENITNNVFVTGNTVIDAFKTTVTNNYIFNNAILKKYQWRGKRIILVTAHRRENIGKPLENICNAIVRIAKEYPDILVIYPVHLNPIVRETVYKVLGNLQNILLLDPLSVLDMHNLIAHSYLILTDSGGLQEEAPAFGKPVLVLRTETERPEAVEAGTVKVVGVSSQDIYRETRVLLEDINIYQKMARAVNPYGDGHASERIADILENIS